MKERGGYEIYNDLNNLDQVNEILQKEFEIRLED